MARRINLIPQSERSRTTTDFGLLALLAAGIVVVFAVAFGYYLLSNSLNDRKQELVDVQQQTAILEGQLTTLEQYERLQAQRVSSEEIVRGIYAGRTLLSEVLDGISLVVPENAWFQSVSLTAMAPAVSGSSTAAGPTAVTSTGDNTLSIEGDTYSFEDIAQVLVRLQLVPSLSDVTLASAGQPRGGADPAKQVKGFSIEARIDSPSDTDVELPLSQVEVEGQ